MTARRSRLRRFPESDVVFYTPFIGRMLTSGQLPPGGAETQILAIAKGLAKLGVRVAIVAYGRREELPDAVEGVRVVARPPSRGNKRLVGKFAEAVHIWRALWRAPSRTVVYRCASPELGLIALYTRLARRRLVFSTANIVDFELHKLTPKRRDLVLYGLGVRLCGAIVVQTEEQVRMCLSSFGRQATLVKSIVTVPPSAGGPPEAFLWVGRLVAYKHPLEYVALAKALPAAKFWMVGVPANKDGAEVPEQTIRDAADRIGNLELLAPRPHTGIQELLSRAVASVNTADFEGMPNMLLEAWSQGVPALVLHHDPGGVVAEHGLGAFAAGSFERLVELAHEQWSSRHDRGALSERCRAYLAAHHTPETVLASWIKVLDVAPRRAPSQAPAEAELTCAG